MDDVRRGVVAVALLQIANRLAAPLDAGAPLLDEQQLALVMAVPCGACGGLETASAGGDVLRIERVRSSGEDWRCRRLLRAGKACRHNQREGEPQRKCDAFHIEPP